MLPYVAKDLFLKIMMEAVITSLSITRHFAGNIGHMKEFVYLT
jgi:hypothetical protein